MLLQDSSSAEGPPSLLQFRQQIRNSDVVVLQSEISGDHPIGCFLIGVCTLFKEQLHGTQMPFRCGEHQRGAAFHRCLVDISTMCKQGFNDLIVSVCRCHHQSRLALVICQIGESSFCQ